MTAPVPQAKAAQPPAGLPDDAAMSNAARRAARFGHYLQLTKPRLTTLVVVTTLVGFLEGSTGALDAALLVHTVFGTFLVAGAAAALNQWAERDIDSAMRRTRGRPLPAGNLTARQALAFGGLLLLAGAAYLWLLANPLASLLALATAASYLLAYTPLKQITSLATVIGAVPGAIPPMIGWAAATGRLEPGAWVLFLIVFFWQMPHFLAIATLCRQDYADAGFRVLPVVDPDGASTGRQAALYALALVPVSLLPAVSGDAGVAYFIGALLLSTAYFALAVHLLADPENIARARRLFRCSLLYLPLLLVLLLAA